MRCRGWSSLGILGCSTAALVFAAPAFAHLSINPSMIHTGDLVDLVFSVPNADDPHGIDHVTLGIPGEFQLDDAEAKPGWTQSRTGQAVTWSGGTIPRREFARFAIRGTAPYKPETVLFNVVVGDRTGKSITYRVGVQVIDHGPQDQGARSLGKAALVVAIVGAAFALGALFLGLYVWLRPPPP
jgi:uncharacterized protein YcnI